MKEERPLHVSDVPKEWSADVLARKRAVTTKQQRRRQPQIAWCTSWTLHGALQLARTRRAVLSVGTAMACGVKEVRADSQFGVKERPGRLAKLCWQETKA